MNLTKSLTQYKQIIDKELELFLDKKLKQAENISPEIEQAIKLLKEYTLRGGKRIRAALIYHSYKCFSNKNIKQVIKASAAIELLQSYLLIHDDIMDRDDLRRNGPTIHKSYKKYKDEHFSNSMAILIGDLAESFANQILNNIKIKPKYKNKALKKLNQTSNLVIYGQILDLFSEKSKDFKEVDLLRIHRYKTATYTIEAPLHIGALLANAKPKHLKTLSNYAIPLGIAFQLKDDILGMFGKQKKVGKPIYSDLKEGKKTLLIIKALEKANPKQKSIIKKALGNQNLKKSLFNQVKTIITLTGSLKYSEDLIQILTNKAINEIKYSKLKQKQFLIELAEFIKNREY